MSDLRKIMMLAAYASAIAGAAPSRSSYSEQSFDRPALPPKAAPAAKKIPKRAKAKAARKQRKAHE